MIVGQETQRDRENDKIAHCHANKEHDAPHEESSLNPFFLLWVQGRCDKGPQEVKHDGKGEHQCQPERRGHVYKELGSKLDIDQLNVEAIGGELG